MKDAIEKILVALMFLLMLAFLAIPSYAQGFSNSPQSLNETINRIVELRGMVHTVPQSPDSCSEQQLDILADIVAPEDTWLSDVLFMASTLAPDLTNYMARSAWLVVVAQRPQWRCELAQEVWDLDLPSEYYGNAIIDLSVSTIQRILETTRQELNR